MRASRATVSVLVRHHSRCGLLCLCLIMRASSTTMSRSYGSAAGVAVSTSTW
ncbi:hypothetical protein PF010_g17085 [Phytophthora fragariae]|uniref:Uncharacterized protein n=2 Tax=Phytophthora TaxID=4783 RepID=A0A6G0KPQ5_9STRA|nr:hypothetical protein PR002_g15899 [Phytophthora rubi]KAE9094472.1 hypothetical protein PF010_g17085 [Phytophthora fragariae]KAE9209403.1 hypothetical protein PF004_g16472 [Phytophthora fragariae]KAE9318015.1 hypothetical protein PF008_g18599 [Phytophthora fragariae]